MKLYVEKVAGGFIIKAIDDKGEILSTMVASTPAKAAGAVKTLLESPPA